MPAARERRAKIVAAEKLGEAADKIAAHPVALQLRTLQTLAEMSDENNTTILFPAQILSTIEDVYKAVRTAPKS